MVTGARASLLGASGSPAPCPAHSKSSLKGHGLPRPGDEIHAPEGHHAAKPAGSETEMFDDDNNDETTPEHVKRLRAEREKYEGQRSNTSQGSGENCGQEWAVGADYAALMEFVEFCQEVDAVGGWEEVRLPEGYYYWQSFPERGDMKAYKRGFFRAAKAVLDQVQAG